MLNCAVLNCRIALGGGDGGMAEDALDDGKWNATGKEQGGTGMAGTVHGDVFADAGTGKGSG